MSNFSETIAPQNGSPKADEMPAPCQPAPASFIELERFDIDVPAMMRGLVHELRNPLAAILTASTLLESVIVPAPDNREENNANTQNPNGFDEESAMLLSVVAKEARRMNAILTEFSHFVKPPTPHIETFDLAKLVRAEVASLRKDAPARWQKIEIADHLPPILEVRGDVNLLSLAVRQVVLNAIEAIPKSGQITLSAAQKETQVALCIDDNGVGLSHDAQGRAFQPFFSQKPAATGLGLSLARMLVRASGGELTLENRIVEKDTVESHQNGAQGSGAHATISLPRA